MCPFDTKESLFVSMLTDHGCNVKHSHINEGKDFFDIDNFDNYSYIISNPPYSIKSRVLEKLFHENVPFAMLLGVVGLFESQNRFDMFKNNDFEIMYFNRRVSYFEDYNDQKPNLNPPFSSVYICHNILPKQIVFEEINKGDY